MPSAFDLLKMGLKLVGHKIEQYNLATNTTEVVNTYYGNVKGIKRRTIYDEEYYAFEGIPYAKPPLGELRFRAPQPPEPWDGVRDCTNCGHKPVQLHFILKKVVIGNEDCLNLNVYAKKLISDAPLPVMVYIYGGSFQFGEASREVYAPDYFMQQDVVLVNMNYRLGALGFLSLEDPDVGVPGNAGLKDILLALRWVKQNISRFNGDANNITLFGESAGAASTHYMMLTDKAKGLFHKAILQSAAVFCPWAQSPQWNWAYRLARDLGYEGSNNDKEVFRFLSKADAHKLAVASARLNTKDEKRQHVLFAFNPVIEPYDSVDAILKKPCVELLAETWANKIPVIMGGTSFEGLYSYPHKYQDSYLIDEIGSCEELLPAEVRQAHSPQELREMGLKLKRAYFDYQEPSVKDSFKQYLDLMSYKNFWEPINRHLLARLKYATDAHTYLYRFDFDSPDFNHYRSLICDKGTRGVAHADDVSYLFYNVFGRKLHKSTPEYKTIQRMVGMWTSFATTSNPNCVAIVSQRWDPVRPNDGVPKCLNISEELDFIGLPEKTKLNLWQSFYTKVPII